MDIKDKRVLLAEELSIIANSDLREFAGWAVDNLPDYFFEVPASSSGKYHPQYALGNGGLLRHTQVAVRIANTLLVTKTFGDQYTIGQKDAILIALILHDSIKHGVIKKNHTVKEHPMLVRPYYEALVSSEINELVGYAKRDALYGLIESHMGQWNIADGVTMPLPKTNAQKFVHLCDYLASRKSLDFNFDA